MNPFNDELILKNRESAGRLLGEKLVKSKLKNPIIVALPRGGVAVAKPIADILGANLSIMVSKKIGAPGNPELAIGAVTSRGDYVISPYDVRGEKWNYIQEQIVYLIKDCQEREKKYLSCCRDLPSASLSCMGRDVVIVDDGIATGMTALAAIKSIKKENPESILLAVPVISLEAYKEIKPLVNEIITVKIPKNFTAVGIHFADFSAVSDEEIKMILAGDF